MGNGNFMSYAEHYNLRPGDELISPIFKTGVAKHHVVYLGLDEDGTEVISENHAKEGVRLVTAHDYFSGTKNFRINPFKGTEQEREAAVSRAFSQLGKSYNLMRHNCEHHVSFVRTGISVSKQVALAFGLSAIFLITCLIIADTNKKYSYGKL
jgi:hypothetical protein